MKIENDVKMVHEIANKYKEIMEVLKIEETKDNRDTPIRVAKALVEMTESIRSKNFNEELKAKCTTFENTNSGVKLEQDGIEFSSMCSHHHLPFVGKVKITYEPGERIIGLSKFNRVVEAFSNKPQVQEDMTMEVGMFLAKLLKPKYLKVEIYDCLHTCMCARGVMSRATTKTEFEYFG